MFTFKYYKLWTNGENTWKVARRYKEKLPTSCTPESYKKIFKNWSALRLLFNTPVRGRKKSVNPQ